MIMKKIKLKKLLPWNAKEIIWFIIGTAIPTAFFYNDIWGSLEPNVTVEVTKPNKDDNALTSTFLIENHSSYDIKNIVLSYRYDKIQGQSQSGGFISMSNINISGLNVADILEEGHRAELPLDLAKIFDIGQNQGSTNWVSLEVFIDYDFKKLPFLSESTRTDTLHFLTSEVKNNKIGWIRTEI